MNFNVSPKEVSQISTGTLVMRRSTSGDSKQWQTEQCFEIIVPSPYEDPSIYKTF